MMHCNFHVDRVVAYQCFARPHSYILHYTATLTNLTAQTKLNLPTEHWRRELEASVNKIRKSAAVKTSEVLKNLLVKCYAHPPRGQNGPMPCTARLREITQ